MSLQVQHVHLYTFQDQVAILKIEIVFQHFSVYLFIIYLAYFYPAFHPWIHTDPKAAYIINHTNIQLIITNIKYHKNT